jgi:hypothetical protein
VEARLVEGGKGIFDVVADGRLIFSKHKARRFPNSGEVVGALRG